MEFAKYSSGDIMIYNCHNVELIDWWEYPEEDDRHAIIYWDVIIREGSRQGTRISVKQRHLHANNQKA